MTHIDGIRKRRGNGLVSPEQCYGFDKVQGNACRLVDGHDGECKGENIDG